MGPERFDQLEADMFSEKNPLVDGTADIMRSTGGKKFDDWLFRQNWLEAF